MARLLKKYKNKNTYNEAITNLFTTKEELGLDENVITKVVRFPAHDNFPETKSFITLTEDEFDVKRNMKVILKDGHKYYMK